MPVEIKELDIKINVVKRSNKPREEENLNSSSSQKEKKAERAFQELLKSLEK